MALISASQTVSHDPTQLGINFKNRLRYGDVLVGGIISEYLRPSLVKLYAQARFDFLYVENEHALFDSSAIADTVQSARDNGMPVIAKTPQLERAAVAKLLGAGVTGIQLPRTESRGQIETLVDYIKYPPLGSRAGDPGFGGTDYTVPSDPRDWLENGNLSTAVVAMIETRAGFEAAEEIISAPQVDMLYVGPYDFSIAMGQPGDYDHPDVRRPMEEMLKICRDYNIAFGTTASSYEAAERWIGLGAQFFEVIDELSLVRAGASQIVQEYRQITTGSLHL